MTCSDLLGLVQVEGPWAEIEIQLDTHTASIGVAKGCAHFRYLQIGILLTQPFLVTFFDETP